MHVDGNTEHCCETDIEVTDVSGRHDAVVGAPVIHDFVGGAEGARAGEARHKPSGGPGGIGALVEGVVHRIRKINGPALRDLEAGAKSGREVKSNHGGVHAAFGAVAGTHAAAGEILGNGGMPGGIFKAGFHFGVGDFPMRFHGGFPVRAGLIAGAIEGGGTGIDKVKESVFSGAFELVAIGDAGYGIRAPVGAEVSEDLGAIGEELTEEHPGAVEGVVLGSENVGRAFAVPVEGSVQDRLHEVAVGEVVGPLALSLETGGDGIVTLCLFTESHFVEFWIPDHEVAGDECHFYGVFPFAIELFAAAFLILAVVVVTFGAVGFDPIEGFFEFVGVVGTLAHASGKFSHVDGFEAHPEVVFPEGGIDDRTGDAHGGAAHGKVCLAAHVGDCETGAGKIEELIDDISGDVGIAGFLHVFAVDAKGGEAFLGMTCERGGEVNRAGALGAVKAPDRLGTVWIHVHRFGTVAPTGGNGDAETDALALEFLFASRSFAHPADVGVGDHAFDG